MLACPACNRRGRRAGAGPAHCSPYCPIDQRCVQAHRSNVSGFKLIQIPDAHELMGNPSGWPSAPTSGTPNSNNKQGQRPGHGRGGAGQTKHQPSSPITASLSRQLLECGAQLPVPMCLGPDSSGQSSPTRRQPSLNSLAWNTAPGTWHRPCKGCRCTPQTWTTNWLWCATHVLRRQNSMRCACSLTSRGCNSSPKIHKVQSHFALKGLADNSGGPAQLQQRPAVVSRASFEALQKIQLTHERRHTGPLQHNQRAPTNSATFGHPRLGKSWPEGKRQPKALAKNQKAAGPRPVKHGSGPWKKKPAGALKPYERQWRGRDHRRRPVFRAAL